MYNLLISLSVLIVVTVFSSTLGFSIVAASFPGFIAFVITFIIRSKKTFKQFEAVIGVVQAELQRQSTIKNPKLRGIDKAIDILKSAYPLARWQFLLKGQIDAQIGILYFQNNRSKDAFPYLENAFLRHWVARGMLGAHYYKIKDYDKMDHAFQVAMKANKKAALLYLIYAWCLQELKRPEEAKNVLQRGLKVIPGHPFMEKSMITLQNQKKIKLKEYGDEWYQFRLEKHPQEVQAQRPVFKQSKKRRIQRR